MIPERVRQLDDRGFSLAELLVVVAIIAILSTMTIPYMVTYLRSSTVTAGAQEMRTAMHRARQLAITLRQPICVQPVANAYQFRRKTTCLAVDVVLQIQQQSEVVTVTSFDAGPWPLPFLSETR